MKHKSFESKKREKKQTKTRRFILHAIPKYFTNNKKKRGKKGEKRDDDRAISRGTVLRPFEKYGGRNETANSKASSLRAIRIEREREKKREKNTAVARVAESSDPL